MSTDASWKIQVSPKTPSGTLINVRGDNGDEVQSGLQAVASIAGDIATTEQLLFGAAAAAPLTAPAGTVPSPTAPSEAPPAYAPPAAAAAPMTCPHGTRVFRTGVGKNNKPWAAYFCPSPKGTPGQCDPEWDRSYGQ